MRVRTYARNIPWEGASQNTKIGELSLWTKSASESEQCEVLARDIYSKLPYFAFFDLQN